MSSADASRQYRMRQAGLIPSLPLCSCGKQIRGTRHGGLCSRCWWKTPEGRADILARVRRARGQRPDPLPPCTTCGRPTRTSAHGGLCSTCWRKTPEGLAAIRERRKQARRR